MPLRRMKAIRTSISSADSISASSWCNNPGSPGALVSRVVSNSGISGWAIGCGVPSGRRRRRDHVQDLARFDRYFGGFGLHDLREPGDEVASHLDADPDSLAVPDRLQRALDAPAQVQRDAVDASAVWSLRLGRSPSSQDSSSVRSASVMSCS